MTKTVKIAAVYDIETHRWDTFVCGGIYFADGSYEEYIDTCENCATSRNCQQAAMADALLEIKGAIAAHYGGGFDHKWLLDYAARKGIPNIKIAAAGSRIIFAKIAKTTLIDTFAMAPISLEEFTKAGGVKKEKLGLPCLHESWCDDACQGYCQIRRTAPADVMRKILKYLHSDCVSLWEAASALIAFCASPLIDLDLKRTVGSSAWEHASRILGLPAADLGTLDHDFAREAYYGGRVQVFRHGYVAVGHEYDVRSMYPWALDANKLPCGNSLRLYSEDVASGWREGRPGVYNVTVRVPYSHIPPLPMRTVKRIYYPYGTFQGTFTRPELEYAIEVGCEVLDWHQALVWEDEQVLFHKWTERIFDLRHHSTPDGPDSPLGIFLKFYANSLTGKLGMDPRRYSYFVNPDKIETCTTPKDCGDECDGECGSMAQLSEFIWRQKSYGLSPCMHVEWAAYLTSYARVKLHRQLVSVDGGEDACYCDTDSVLSLKPRAWDVGDQLGQFEHKRIWHNAHFWAPKVYEIDDDKKGHIVKAKGLPKGIKIEDGKSYRSERIIGFTAGARAGKLFTRGTTSRKFTPRFGDRIADGETTRPMSVAEAIADSKKR